MSLNYTILYISWFINEGCFANSTATDIAGCIKEQLPGQEDLLIPETPKKKKTERKCDMKGKVKSTYLIVAGFIICLLGIYSAMPNGNATSVKNSNCTEETSGVVREVSSYNSISAGRMYRVTLEYEAGGEPLTLETTSRYSVDQGQSVAVHYNPADSSEIYVEELEDSKANRLVKNIIMIVIGAFVVYLGVQARMAAVAGADE